MFKKVLLSFLLFILISNIHADNLQHIDVQLNNISLREFFSYIEKNYPYTFMYDNTEINDKVLISVEERNQSIVYVLSSVLKNKDIDYEIQGYQIVLSKKNVSTQPNIKQQRKKTVTGLVIDENGNPVIGANVIEKGTTNGTVTDMDGNFSLLVEVNAVLQISYIGYLAQDFPTAGMTTCNIILLEDMKTLEELVVVGYGTQKKVNLTGSVTTVKYDQELEARPITDVSQIFQGKVPGVWATQFTGNPGEDGATLRIRGYGTISTTDKPRDPSPLVLIDGIEGRMSDVNPSSIESVTVLKDAASAAIYGSRAANGVILIQTKRGKTDKIQFNYNGYAGVQQLAHGLDLISNSADYMELWNEALVNTGSSPLFPDDVIAAFRNGNDPYKYPNTDFSRAIFRNAFTTQHTLSANVGSEKSSTYLSLSYMSNNGILYNTSSEKISMTINNETKINEWLRIGGRARMQHRVNLEPGGNETTGNSVTGINRALYMVSNGHPFATPYLQDGKTFGASQAVYLSGDKIGQPIVDTRNPFPDLYNGERRTLNNFFLGNVFLTITPFNGLNITANYSGQYTNNTRDMYNQANYAYLALDENGNGIGKTKSLDYITKITNQRLINDKWYSTFFVNMNYNRTFNQIHEISGMAGYQQEELVHRYTLARRTDPPKDELHQVNAGTDNIEGYGNKYTWRMLSYFGRINYALMGKYLFEINLRADGSSRFAKGNRWGTFPSYSAGWRLGEENFIKSMGFFDNLKLRLSYGKLGNQDTGNRNNNDYFPYLTIVTQDNSRSYNYGNTLAPGAAVIGLSDSAITWETSTITDIGVDIGMLKNRLNIEADYFYKSTSNLLVDLPLPLTMGGLNPPFENIGKMVNKGFEINVGWQDHIPQSNFSYNLGANLTVVNNKVTKFQEGKSPDQTFLIREGYSFRSLYGYINEGVYQSDKEGADHLYANSYKPVAGDLRYKDINGDGKIDNNDMTVLGNTIPKYTYGFNGSFKWKNFDLSFLFSGAGGYIAYFNNAWSQPLAVSGGTIFKKWYNRWTPEQPSSTLPRITINNAWLRDYPSTFWTADMWWLKLKNIQLGYLIPTTVVQKLKIQKLYVYSNVTELFTLVSKDYEGFDPEKNTMDNGYYQYPVPRVFTLGLNITF